MQEATIAAPSHVGSSVPQVNQITLIDEIQEILDLPIDPKLFPSQLLFNKNIEIPHEEHREAKLKQNLL